MTATTIRIIVAAVLGVGLFVMAYYGPRAWAAEPRAGCQIYIQRPGEDWQPFTTKGRPAWTFTSCSACSMDLGGAIKGEVSGTAMACVDIRKQAVRR